MTAVPACVMVHVLSGWDSGLPDNFIAPYLKGQPC